MALSSILVTPASSSQPKPSSQSSSASSFAASNSSDGSQASQQSSSSSNSSSANDSGNSTRKSGMNSSGSNNTSSSSQAQNSSGSSQSQQSSSAAQAQATSAASGRNAAQASKTPGASFMQALAQSQADAADSVSVSAGADPQAVTGKGKGKTAAKDSTGTDSSAALTFMPQSVVAAMAGIQQPNAAQGTDDGDDSVDGVSLSSGTSAQSLSATLLQTTASELKEAGSDATQLDSDSNAAATTATASAASTFQSHMGVGSQIQSSATQDPANTQVNSSIGSSGFADEVGDKITWMAHQGVQSASLQMTPEHMGPVEVKISMQDGSATVSINAAHADTRAALEQALPRLREMFSSQGLNLADANVSQQFQRGQQQKQASGPVSSVSGVSEDSSAAVVSVTSARLGLVDTYA